MDDVWGAFHKGRGIKPGQLGGSNYINKPMPSVTKVYIGNLSQKAGLDEVKEQIGLNKKEYVLADPRTAEDKRLYWMERKPGDNFCFMCTRDKKLAQRIVNYCKGQGCVLHGRKLRVDLQHHGAVNMQWSMGHAPQGGDWACDSKQISKDAKKSYKLHQTSYKRDFSGGMQYDVAGAASYLRNHPAGSKAYKSVADGGRRGAVKHGLVGWWVGGRVYRACSVLLCDDLVGYDGTFPAPPRHLTANQRPIVAFSPATANRCVLPRNNAPSAHSLPSILSPPGTRGCQHGRAPPVQRCRGSPSQRSRAAGKWTSRWTGIKCFGNTTRSQRSSTVPTCWAVLISLPMVARSEEAGAESR